MFSGRASSWLGHPGQLTYSCCKGFHKQSLGSTRSGSAPSWPVHPAQLTYSCSKGNHHMCWGSTSSGSATRGPTRTFCATHIHLFQGESWLNQDCWPFDPAPVGSIPTDKHRSLSWHYRCGQACATPKFTVFSRLLVLWMFGETSNPKCRGQ